ncbi:MAG: formate dehydrogenase subunit alpha [Myxococcota bacterium]|nr:formate dehydrogenase subunit alpha [Myxococcota bacterium]
MIEPPTEAATIDGRSIVPEPGETILAAARRLGIEIPSLCAGPEQRPAPEWRPEGGCRLCTVEVTGVERPMAACHTALAPGSEVRTRSERIQSVRREILRLHLSSYPRLHVAPETLLGRLLAEHGLDAPERPLLRDRLDESAPYLRFDPDLCIVCRRCVHACSEVEGQDVFDVAERGASVRLICGEDDLLAHSDCTSCGACVSRCPTGALFDRDRDPLAFEPATSRTESVCGYCGVGCRVAVESHEDRVLRIGGVEDAEVNRGHLCAKGRYAHAWQHSPDRLDRPLLRRDGRLEPASWEEALDFVATRLSRIRDEHGADALGVFTSSRSTNEAAYLLQRMFRAQLGSNHVDCCARVCHSSTALALQQTTGTGAASASYVDVDRASCIVLAGSNATEAHPVIGARIKQAVRRGADLIVIDPREIELAGWAEHHLALRPGTNVALLNAIARVLVEEGLCQKDFVDQRCEGFDALYEFLARSSLEEAAEITHVRVAAIQAAARRIGAGDPVLFVHGLGLSELVQGTASVMALTNLGMLTGSIGVPGAGMLPLRGQNNVQGNADMGGMPDQITGHQALADEDARARAERLWGSAPPLEAGKTIPEMLDAAREGSMRALWIQGEDVAQSDPDETHVLEALDALDLLVVQEMFPTETAARAHVVLPAAGYLEQDGTFINGERRIQRVRRAVAPPGEARPDWEVAQEVAQRLGANRRFEDPAEVWDEIAEVAPRLFGGVSYARLEGDGIQWPCPEPDHPGTSTVHADGFIRGKGALVCVDHEPSPEHGVEEHPWLLVTGRVLHQYNVGTMTRRTPQQELEPEDRLEIHPGDARRLGIEEGDRVRVTSRWGTTEVPADVSHRVPHGVLFLSFHQPGSHTNRVVGPHLDPASHCPQYKATAVTIEPV